MWQTVDYKGKPVKWYEAELIEDLVRLCKTEIALDNWGKYFAEKKICRAFRQKES